jgi:hypothetical protein
MSSPGLCRVTWIRVCQSRGNTDTDTTSPPYIVLEALQAVEEAQ